MVLYLVVYLFVQVVYYMIEQVLEVYSFTEVLLMSLIHISEPTRHGAGSRMPSSG